MSRSLTVSSPDETERFIVAIEQYYGMAYRDVIRKAIRHALGRPPKAYLLALFQAVIETHPTSYRSLPDVAILRKAQSGLSRPETYAPAPEPETDPRAKDFAERIQRVIAETSGEAPIYELAGDDGEPNHTERQRVRTRAMRGDATVQERWWIHIIDECSGVWRAMPEGWGA